MTRNRHTRKILAGIFTGLTAGAMILSGCSGGATPAPDGSGSDAAPAPNAPAEFSISWMGLDSWNEAVPALAEKYMKEFPNVKITLNEMPSDSYYQLQATQLQAGNASDVILVVPGVGQTISIVTLGKAGLLAELDKTSTGIIPSGYEPLFQVDGKTYGQPLTMTTTALIFNETAAESAGVTFPKDTTAMLAACKASAAKGVPFIALAGAVPINSGLLAQMISATRVYADAPNWNQQRAEGKVTFAGSQGWKDTLQTIVDMKENECFQPGALGSDFAAVTQMMTGSKAIGAVLPGGAAAGFQKQAPGIKVTAREFPAAAGKKAFTLAGTNYAFAITERSTNKEAAQAFLDWLAKTENAHEMAAILGDLPAVAIDKLDLSKTAYAPVEKLLHGGSFAPLPNSSWSNAAVYDALTIGAQGLVSGQRTVDQVLQAMDAAWG